MAQVGNDKAHSEAAKTLLNEISGRCGVSARISHKAQSNRFPYRWCARTARRDFQRQGRGGAQRLPYLGPREQSGPSLNLALKILSRQRKLIAMQHVPASTATENGWGE